jgi:hypothetical protein
VKCGAVSCRFVFFVVLLLLFLSALRIFAARLCCCSCVRYVFLQLAAMSTRGPGSPSSLRDSFEPRRSPRRQDAGSGRPSAEDAVPAPAAIAATSHRSTAGRSITAAAAAAGSRSITAAAAATAGSRSITAAAAGRAVIAAAAGRAATARNPPVAVMARSRGLKYHKDEIEAFLDIMEDHLPIGPQEWEDVTEAHNDRFPMKNRDKDSLRRKFNEFVNSKKPTGDPQCPPHIRKAKLIARMIIAKSDSSAGVLNDEELAFGGDDDDNYDDDGGIEPQNLLPTLNTTAMASMETATVPTRSMVTPRRRNEYGSSSGGSNIASLVDIMAANMMERQQSEIRLREEQLREREERLRDREERYNREREEREERREERRADQEDRRLDRAQLQQQTMMMMMAFGKSNGVVARQAPHEGAQEEDLLE